MQSVRNTKAKTYKNKHQKQTTYFKNRSLVERHNFLKRYGNGRQSLTHIIYKYSDSITEVLNPVFHIFAF